MGLFTGSCGSVGSVCSDGNDGAPPGRIRFWAFVFGPGGGGIAGGVKLGKPVLNVATVAPITVSRAPS